MSIDTPTVQKSVLELKSSSFNVPTLVLASSELAAIVQQLEKKIAQAPELFKHSPLLLDLHRLTAQHADIQIDLLVKMLRELQFSPIAICGATEKQNAQAVQLGLALQSARKESPLPVVCVPEEPEELEIAASTDEPSFKIENKIITQPVRSGQKIYATGDLTVLAPVSSSAELMAEGNIHVYAPLRGRALAGVHGNLQSRIFCSDFQAELISIAGIYQLNDEFCQPFHGKLVQIYLENQTLRIAPL